MPGEGSRVKGTVKCFHTPMKQMQRHAARRGAVYSKLQQKAVVEFNLNLNQPDPVSATCHTETSTLVCRITVQYKNTATETGLYIVAHGFGGTMVSAAR